MGQRRVALGDFAGKPIRRVRFGSWRDTCVPHFGPEHQTILETGFRFAPVPGANGCGECGVGGERGVREP